MRKLLRNLGIYLTVGALSATAFIAGAQLRAFQSLSVPSHVASVQANALLKLTPESSPVTLSKDVKSTLESKELVSDVIRLLKAHYVESVTPQRETEMARGVVRGMLNSLADPDSRFLDSKERALLDDAARGKFHGIGAVFALRTEDTTVRFARPSTDTLRLDSKLEAIPIKDTKVIAVAPMPGSPAEQAGLQPGDSITHMGGKWIVTHDPYEEAGLAKLAKAVRNKEIDELAYEKAFNAADKKLKEGMSIADALENLTAKSSGELNLRVDRPGRSKPIELKIRCNDTQIDPVTSRTLKKGITCIRISQLTRRASNEFSVEVDRAVAGRAKALVLDLRNNPGGVMDAAADMARKITGGGVVAVVHEKNRKHSIRLPKARGLSIPVVVLVNGGTASVAELLAGTLRDNSAAILVGTKTFGDGLVQTPLLLRDGSAAVLTTGKMLTAKGVDFEGKGIKPDKEVVQTGRGDSQLQEAEAVILAKLGKV